MTKQCLSLRRRLKPFFKLFILNWIFQRTELWENFHILLYVKRICDALHDLVPFVQFTEREKHPWRSLTFSKNLGPFYNLKNAKNTHKGVTPVVACNCTKSSTPPWVFLTFYKLCKWYLIAQSITFDFMSALSMQ